MHVAGRRQEGGKGVLACRGWWEGDTNCSGLENEMVWESW